MPLLFWVIFAAVFVIVLIATWSAASYTGRQQERVILKRVGGGNKASQTNKVVPSVLYQRFDPAAKRSPLQRVPGLSLIARQITAAGLEWRPEVVLLSMVGLAFLGTIIGSHLRVLSFPELSAAALAFIFGSAPYIYIARKRNKRLATFEKQFPDTLDFIARAVSAGHALSVSLEMLSNDAPEPTRTEIRRVFAEHNLGASLDSALAGLVQRVPLIDVRFFVSAVLLQRETGGNLSEILMNLGDVIRDRFMLKGRVKAATAHARMTAVALTLIPIVVFVLLSLIMPGYLTPLREDFHGRIMFAGAVAGQVIGYLVMKKMINIKV
jgi:tight adherence protein B